MPLGLAKILSLGSTGSTPELDALLQQQLASETAQGQALRDQTMDVAATNAEASLKLQEDHQAELEQALSTSDLIEREHNKQVDYNQAIIDLNKKNKVATATLNKSVMERYNRVANDPTTEENLMNAVANRQEMQDEINAMNAKEGVGGFIERLFTQEYRQNQLTRVDNQILAMQQRKGTAAINANQQMIANQKIVENTSAKDMAHHTRNLQISKSLVDTYQKNMTLNVSDMEMMSRQLGFNASSTASFINAVSTLQADNNLYADAVNAEVRKLQVAQEVTRLGDLKKSYKNDEEYYKAMQPLWENFIEQSGRPENLANLDVKSILTTAQKERNPIANAFLLSLSANQSDPLKPYSSYQRRLLAGEVDPTDPYETSLQKEVQQAVDVYNAGVEQEIAINPHKAAQLKTIHKNNPNDVELINDLIVSNRARMQRDATQAVNTGVITIPSIQSMIDDPSPESRAKMVEIYGEATTKILLDGTMDQIPTEITRDPATTVSKTISATVNKIFAADREADEKENRAKALRAIQQRAQILAKHYEFVRKGLNGSSDLNLKHISFSGIDSYRTGSESMKDPEAFDITNAGAWATKLTMAYIQRVQLETAKSKSMTNLTTGRYINPKF